MGTSKFLKSDLYDLFNQYPTKILQTLFTQTLLVLRAQSTSRLIVQLNLGTPAALERHAANEVLAAGFAFQISAARDNRVNNIEDLTHLNLHSFPKQSLPALLILLTIRCGARPLRALRLPTHET